MITTIQDAIDTIRDLRTMADFTANGDIDLDNDFADVIDYLKSIQKKVDFNGVSK